MNHPRTWPERHAERERVKESPGRGSSEASQTGNCTVEGAKAVQSTAIQYPVFGDYHDDKLDGRPDLQVSTQPNDLDTFGRPLRPWR